MVWQVAQKVRIPVIGMGGIVSVQDAVEFLMAGARGIAIGTGTMIDPYTAPKIVEGLGQWLENHGYTGVSEIIGKALPQNCS
ncbi:Dihydroorotate dehydrogenase B (NAD(+)), catalytic subunit [bioreactor metagenome]|uniref:Dihydroorotate dehydrogenase B (NAD(+)), catalytic subunit n=1 Tax=bioreactor metagenome TaxID=1076179 RepID=A0A645G176_9ZZZZ